MPHAPNTPAFYRRVLDSVSAMVVVVDADLVVRFANRRSIAGLNLASRRVTGRRGGEALGCVHRHDDPAGCGFGEHCRSECVIRRAVRAVLAGREVHRERLAMTRERGGGTVEANLLLAASPLRVDGETLVAITVEDVSELIRLQSIVPICAHCKKVRNDRDYWESVEQYLAARVDVSFSHGYCPECVEKHYRADLDAALEAAAARGGAPALPRKPRSGE